MHPSQTRRRFYLLHLFVIGLIAVVSQAAIVPSGDVTPVYNGTTDPWNLGNSALQVGEIGTGMLVINGGSDVISVNGFIGHKIGSHGTVSVDGIGSKLINTNFLSVGRFGHGTLNIMNSGVVEVKHGTSLSSHPTGIGAINFNNGTLNTGGLWAPLEQLSGTGTINTKGLVTDIDLVFDAVTGLQQTILLNNMPGQYITVNLDASAPEMNHDLGAGYSGTGTLTITDGLSISSQGGYLGRHDGASGTASVSGIGSRWSITESLDIGYYGTGILNIDNGAVVEVNFDTNLGLQTSGSGVINFNDGTLNTRSLSASHTDLRGTGTINTKGLLSDMDLVFDATTGNQQTFVLNSLPQQEVTINLDTSIPANNGDLGAGYRDVGSLMITDGVSIISRTGYLGYHPGASGTATITGPGSHWHNNSRNLYVGYQGAGTLLINNGGSVRSSNAYIGYIDGSTGSATISGAGSSWNISTLEIANQGYGDLIIEAGGELHGWRGYIGRNTDSMGTVTVTGPGSQWNTSLLDIGIDGSGTLYIDSSGVVEVSQDTHVSSGINGTGRGVINFSGGTLNTGGLLTSPGDIMGHGVINTHGLISDVDLLFDSTNGLQKTFNLNSLPGQNVTVNLDLSIPELNTGLGVGYRGAGTLSISEGIAVSSAKGYLGYHPGSAGTANVSGAGSRWDNTAVLDVLTIGLYGDGTLNIENGGAVSVSSFRSDAYLGRHEDSTGTVTVTDPGSTLTLSYGLDVGHSGTGILNIKNGGSVSFDYVFDSTNIGRDAGSNGTITVSGPGSTLINPKNLWVGYSGTGTLNIGDGALVSIGGGGITGDLRIGQNSGSVGTVNLTGGTLDMNANDIQGVSFNSATFNFTGGTLKNAKEIDVGDVFLQQGGTLAPGGPIGHTIFVRDYTLAAGTIEIELGGEGNSHDLLTAYEYIDIGLLGTTLDLPAIGAMAAGTYTVIESSNGITGTFEHITGLGIHPGLIDVNYTANAVTVTLNWDYLPGDLNGDGFVGIDDLNTILTAWNQNVTTGLLASGDITGDGFIGIGDLTAVLANWNTSTPPPPQVLSAIPEPMAAGMMVLGMMCLGTRRYA